MSETYKFNIGDKVSYQKTTFTDEICPTCGQEEHVESHSLALGVIEECKYEVVYRLEPITMTTESFTDAAGRTLHRPYLATPKVQSPEPVYKVNGVWLYENEVHLREKSNAQGSQKRE